MTSYPPSWYAGPPDEEEVPACLCGHFLEDHAPEWCDYCDCPNYAEEEW